MNVLYHPSIDFYNAYNIRICHLFNALNEINVRPKAFSDVFCFPNFDGTDVIYFSSNGCMNI